MSIKSMGKIAAVVAAAGLALTGCANDDASQARAQEETCGVLMGSSNKANEAASRAMQSGESGGPRAARVIESAALDLRNHSFDRSDDVQVPGTDETVALRTMLQVQAELYDEMATAIEKDPAAINSMNPDDIEVNGMTITEANEIVGTYCGSYFNS